MSKVLTFLTHPIPIFSKHHKVFIITIIKTWHCGNDCITEILNQIIPRNEQMESIVRHRVNPKYSKNRVTNWLIWEFESVGGSYIFIRHVFVTKYVRNYVTMFIIIMYFSSIFIFFCTYMSDYMSHFSCPKKCIFFVNMSTW